MTGTCPPTTVIFGANGYLGRCFSNAYAAMDLLAYKTHSPASGIHPMLDFCDPNLSALPNWPTNCQDALICGGATGLLRCETDPIATRQCNVVGTLRLVEQLASKQIKPIYFSTDYVFDGSKGPYHEDDLVHPLNEYAKQKVDVEQGIQSICGNRYLIIRPCKIYGLEKGDSTLLNVMADRLQHGQAIQAATDQVFSPIWVEDLVSATVHLQANDRTGIIHVCSSVPYTRCQIAFNLANEMNCSADLIKPISLDKIHEPFLRPKNTSLHCARLPSEIQNRFLSIKEAITVVANHAKSHDRT